MRYAQLVMGPAGSGKSTYCSALVRHCETIRRLVRVINLDPAAEHFNYTVSIDVRDLIHLDDVMEDDELKLGPNGGLVFCMEYLVNHLDWLRDELEEGEDDYFLIDCPGQIELFTHIPVMRQIVDTLHRWDFRICGVFLVDSQFLIDGAKLLSGVLTAMSAMVQLEIPHVNVMSKMDLLTAQQKRKLESYLDVDTDVLIDDIKVDMTSKYFRLNRALASLISDYSLVKLRPLNVKDEDSIGRLLYEIDIAIQYGEDLEPRTNFPEEEDVEDEGRTENVAE